MRFLIRNKTLDWALVILILILIPLVGKYESIYETFIQLFCSPLVVISNFQNKRALVELEKCKSNSGAKIQLQDLSEVDGWVMINMRLLTPEVWSGSYNAQMTTTLASCWRRVTSPRWQWGRAVLWSHAASSLAELVFSSHSLTHSIFVMRRFVHLTFEVIMRELLLFL